jgi:hypothetical protein
VPFSINYVLVDGRRLTLSFAGGGDLPPVAAGYERVFTGDGYALDEEFCTDWTGE